MQSVVADHGVNSNNFSVTAADFHMRAYTKTGKKPSSTPDLGAFISRSRRRPSSAANFRLLFICSICSTFHSRHVVLVSSPASFIPGNPFCRSASYSTTATEFARFRERVSPIIGILTAVFG